MPIHGFASRRVLGLGLAATLAAALPAAAVRRPTRRPAVLVSSPDAKPELESARRHPRPARPRRPAAGTAPSTAAAPAATVKAEGWGTLKGKVVFGGTPPELPPLAGGRQGRQGPRDLRQDRGRSPTRGWSSIGHQGRQERLRLPPAAHRRQRGGQEGGAGEAARVRPEELHVHPACPGRDDRGDGHHEVERPDQSQRQFPAQGPEPESDDGPGRHDGRQARGARTRAWPGELQYSPVDDGLLAGPRPPLFRRDRQGRQFEIKNAPAGTQKVVVWQEAVSYVTPTSGEAITIKANDTTTQDFTIDPSKVKPGG